MVHLQKQTNTQVQGIELKRLACVTNPFVKGLVLTVEEFERRFEEHPEHCCKKCVKIYNRMVGK